MKKSVLSLGELALFSLLSLIVVYSSTVGAIFKRYGEERIIFSSAESTLRTVILDAGHGGEDSGAVGINGILEKDINLTVTLEIGRILTEKGYRVIYTRTEDKLLYTQEQNIKGIRKINDLKNRCKIAGENEGAVFVSIHQNFFSEEKYSGLQVYYSTANDTSRILAESIQKRVREEVQPENRRKVKKGEGIYLMEHIEGEAVLIECGFLSNQRECDLLSQKEYQNMLSFSIVCGIIEYMEVLRAS